MRMHTHTYIKTVCLSLTHTHTHTHTHKKCCYKITHKCNACTSVCPTMLSCKKNRCTEISGISVATGHFTWLQVQISGGYSFFLFCFVFWSLFCCCFVFLPPPPPPTPCCRWWISCLLYTRAILLSEQEGPNMQANMYTGMQNNNTSHTITVLT